MTRSVQFLEPFDLLKEISNESIFVALTNEHPQTVAVILACMQPKQAAYIIEGLAPERQLAVIRRMATMRQVERVVLEIIENELYKQVSNQDYVHTGGIDTVAEALLYVDIGTTRNIMENLAQDDPELVEVVKKQMHITKNLGKFNRINKGI